MQVPKPAILESSQSREMDECSQDPYPVEQEGPLMAQCCAVRSVFIVRHSLDLLVDALRESVLHTRRVRHWLH